MVHGNKFIVVLDNGNYIGCKDEKALEFILQEAEIFQTAIYKVYRRNKKGHFIIYPFEEKFPNITIRRTSWLDSVIKQSEKQFSVNQTDFSNGKEIK